MGKLYFQNKTRHSQKQKKHSFLPQHSLPSYELILCRSSAEYLFIASAPRCQTFMTHFSSRYLQQQLGAREFNAGNMEVFIQTWKQTQEGSK